MSTARVKAVWLCTALIFRVPDLDAVRGGAGLVWALTLSLTLNQW